MWVWLSEGVLGWHAVKVAVTASGFLRKHQVPCLAPTGSAQLWKSGKVSGHTQRGVGEEGEAEEIKDGWVGGVLLL